MMSDQEEIYYRAVSYAEPVRVYFAANDLFAFLDKHGYIRALREVEQGTEEIPREWTSGNYKIIFPEAMGDVWCVIAKSTDELTREKYQLYASPYGYLKVQLSPESILIDVRDSREVMNVFKILDKAGWEPELVGVLKYIRCPMSKVKHTEYGHRKSIYR